MKKTLYAVWEVEYTVQGNGEKEPVLIQEVKDGIECWREAHALKEEMHMWGKPCHVVSYEVEYET